MHQHTGIRATRLEFQQLSDARRGAAAAASALACAAESSGDPYLQSELAHLRNVLQMAADALGAMLAAVRISA